MQMTQLDFLAPALGPHPTPLGTEGISRSQAAALVTGLHWSGGIWGWAGESEPPAVGFETSPLALPLPQHLISTTLSNEVHGGAS